MPTPAAYPMACGHWLVQQDRLECRLPRKTLTISAPAPLLRAVLELCDGQTAWQAVTARLGERWSPGSVNRFLEALAGAGAIVDAGVAAGPEAQLPWAARHPPSPSAAALSSASAPSTSFSLVASRAPGGAAGAPASAARNADPHADAGMLSHPAAASGMPSHTAAASALAALLRQRERPCRTFADRAIAAASLASLLGAMHPAAGWEVTVLRPLRGGAGGSCELLAPGHYAARFDADGGVRFVRLSDSTDDAWRSLSDPRILTFASAVLVASASAAATELPAAELMARALGLGCAMLPGPCLALGTEASPEDDERCRQGDWIRLANWRLVDGVAPSRFAYLAGPMRFGSHDIYTSGRAESPRLAIRKAEAEAWERKGWATLGSTREGSFREFPGAVDPRSVIRYSARQHASPNFPFAAFNARRHFAWSRGTDVFTGADAWLPAECVHALGALPERYRSRPLTSTSTSGVAAWPTAEGALARAALELLERDAFLGLWVERASPPQLRIDSLPEPARQRVRRFQAAGGRVGVAQIGGLAPVITVFVQSVASRFTLVTAGADFDAEVALGKALDEAETRFARLLHGRCEPIAAAGAVRSLEDIHRLYQSPRHYRRADFYAAGPCTERFGALAGACTDWEGLTQRLALAGRRLLAFDITPAHAAVDQGRVPLRVMRAVIPGLLPIWFGAGLEPAGLRPIRHRLIHPFT